MFVTGARGLVGSELVPALRGAGHEVRGSDLPEGDVTDPAALAAAASGFPPDWVVNLAAWTDVDACEGDPERARRANALGAENAALLARDRGARLLQVSTDYVYDGKKRGPYVESDPPSPLSAYGRSKLEGEERARAALPGERLLVVRGQSLYGRGRKSFPDAILRAAARGPEVPVVTDQSVAPTWAREFAAGLALLLGRGASGTFLLSASGACTWNEFARAVLEEWGVAGARITPTTAAALGRPAPRPASSAFDCARFERETGVRPRPWREQLRAYRASGGAAA